MPHKKHQVPKAQSAAPLPHYMEERIILETLTSETEEIVYVSGIYGLV